MRVALVSGGGRGLGAAIAHKLLADGWAVSIGARRPQEVADRFADASATPVHTARFDADDPETADAWVHAAAAHFGRLDALVNNAGLLKMVSFDKGTEADLDDMWQVNVKAPFRLIRAALPHLRASGQGRVVNIASTDGKRYRDATTSLGYVMTKHALVAMTHACRFAGWDDGVRATAICPGAIDTEMIAGIPGVTPVAERLQPTTVADIVAFLLSLPNQASVPEFIANTR
ncbi:MAG: SDR family NAD(P)-dependent oxidoreductase, partial [Pseudomonadota bacterium]